jgi:hypothetical protein
VIAHALTAISVALENAGMNFAGFALNGSSAEAQVTWFPTDADAPRNPGLQVGLEWNYNPTPSALEPFYGVSKVTVTNPLTGAALLERALERRARLCRVHLYVRETRAPRNRSDASSLPTAFMDLENRILKTLTTSRRDWRLTVDGVQRGFVTEYVPLAFPPSRGLELHGVYAYRIHYPVLDPGGVEGVFVPTRINLVTGEPVTPPRDLGNTPEPVTVPPPGRVTVLENP